MFLTKLIKIGNKERFSQVLLQVLLKGFEVTMDMACARSAAKARGVMGPFSPRICESATPFRDRHFVRYSSRRPRFHGPFGNGPARRQQVRPSRRSGPETAPAKLNAAVGRSVFRFRFGLMPRGRTRRDVSFSRRLLQSSARVPGWRCSRRFGSL